MKEICGYITNCKKWSDYVDNHTDQVQRLSNNIYNVTLLSRTLEGAEEWKVTKNYKKDNGTDIIIERFVSIFGSGSVNTHPSCKDCEYFQSSWEPCECMGAVFSRKEAPFKDIVNLYPYLC